ncbi:MAG: exodeoxyribonuclease V subunit gamma [Desulfobacterales bacterium]|jgi:exodeoxyribonuclease V gamma subunit
MPGLNIFTSNKLEILAAQLAQQLKTPVSETLKPEIIVIQSAGMERWISQELARHNGICANIHFPFPNTFLGYIAQQVLPDDEQPSLFEPDVLMFRIMKVLPACTITPGFERLRAYLSDDTNRLKELQISSKLADLYDQYQVFRPDMIIRWEQGDNPEHDEDRWQAELWRQLQNGHQNQHRARQQRNVIEHLHTHPELFPDLPQRIFMFGISYLPRFHLEAFAAVSEVVETNVYLLNPCQEYWGDIISQKKMQRIQRTYSHTTDATTELHLEEGNRLLASMGSHGKDFHTVISGFDIQIHENYQDPGCTTLLSCIQSDILNLRDRRPVPAIINDQNNSLAATTRPPQLVIDPSDTTIQIHCCHSPMRETEVLHDNLLAMFEADPQLRPKDIVVMTPDIDIYAPYIQAVFDTGIDERLHIPFSIADCGARYQGRLIDGFSLFLELKGSRFSVSRILRLLEAPGVREKFGLNRRDVEIVERWIHDTRIRWGIDANHRRQLGLPALSENTWYAGIRQLLLGYALPGNHQRMFDDIWPYDAVEGNDIHSLGKFLDFSDAVFRYARGLTGAKSLRNWSLFFKHMLDYFFLPDEEIQGELISLRSILDGLGQRQTDVAFNEKLVFEPIRFYLERQLDKLQFSSGFMTSGVTFCAMLPMRSIPFKVVCLMGMNSDAFPRDAQPTSFDQIAQHPRPSDRSRRNDDKYLFLESIISARNTLYISYVGQSIQDNSRMPPSPLVSELLDTIEKGFELPGKNIREHVLRFHRLQAFSAEYFTKEGPLFSYSSENCDAAAFVSKNKTALPLITRAIPLKAPEEAEWRVLDIESLCRFFRHPTRFLLQQRLGIYLEQTEVLTEKREDFELDPLDQFHVGQRLLSTRMAGHDLDACRSAQMARGHFPHGNVGTLMYNKMSSAVDQFAGRVETMQEKRIAEPVALQINIDEFNLLVRMPNIYKSGLVQYRYANQRAQDLLDLWIYHLVLCDRTQADLPRTSVMLFKDSVWQFGPVDYPRDILAELLAVFKAGLEKPLHFFPATSFAYVFQQKINNRSEKQAMDAARRNWLGTDYSRGESDDSYVDICFKSTDPLDSHFADVSSAVIEPLLANGGPVEYVPSI